MFFKLINSKNRRYANYIVIFFTIYHSYSVIFLHIEYYSSFLSFYILIIP